MFVRHGGVHFTAHVEETEINQYVDQLPESKKENMYEVMKELEKKGYITIHNDGLFADGEGELEGSKDC